VYASTWTLIWHRLVNLNKSVDFVVRGSVTRKRGRNSERGPSSGDLRVVFICFTFTTSKPKSTSPLDMSSARVCMGSWRMTAFVGCSLFGRKGVVVEFVVVKKALIAVKSAISLVTTFVPFLVLRSSKVPFTRSWMCFYSWIRFLTAVSNYRWWPFRPRGCVRSPSACACCCCSSVSASISDVRKDAKKFRSGTCIAFRARFYVSVVALFLLAF
jgi:hypothetical protein